MRCLQKERKFDGFNCVSFLDVSSIRKFADSAFNVPSNNWRCPDCRFDFERTYRVSKNAHISTATDGT